MLLADYLYLNEGLAKIYGLKAPAASAGFQRVPADPKRRAGIVTHPFLLTTLAYHNSSSPIHRGVFLTRNILGMNLKSPPMANKFEVKNPGCSSAIGSKTKLPRKWLRKDWRRSPIGSRSTSPRTRNPKGRGLYRLRATRTMFMCLVRSAHPKPRSPS